MLAILMATPCIGTGWAHDGSRSHEDAGYSRHLVRGDARVEVPAESTRERLSSQIEILVDSEEFWNRLEADIASAEEYVHIQTMSFEGDRVGHLLSAALMACDATDRRMLVDSYSQRMISDRFLLSPLNWFDCALWKEVFNTWRLVDRLRSGGVAVKWTNPMDPLLVRFPARNHKKIVLVDDRIVYLGGINFCEHNFQWHDMMLRIEHPDIARFLRNDFMATWDGQDVCATGDFGTMKLYLFDGRCNGSLLAAIFDLIAGATEEIYVVSPYVSFPFFDKLRQAEQNGAVVTLITPEKNNKGIIRDYILWEAQRSGFDLRLYQGGMSHLKAVLIDDSILIMGSSNLDYFSSTLQQEIIAIITDQAVIAAFKARVIVPDLTNCIKFQGRVGNLIGYGRYGTIKVMGKLSVLANRAMDLPQTIMRRHGMGARPGGLSAPK